MPLPFNFNFKNPDYMEVFDWRIERLNRIRQNPEEIVPLLHVFYRDNPIQFITDWGTTFDPRNTSRRLPALIPFILFPRQEEFLHWVLQRWKSEENGVAVKSRDMGVSWLCVSLGCVLAMFNDNLVVGYGSRKEEYVDGKSPRSLFFKGRQFIKNVPVEFRGTWNEKKHSRHMHIDFPTGSSLIGEAGDNIGRGDRTSIFFPDESAFIQRPELIEASLLATTNCRIDVSTPNGPGNPFAIKAVGGTVPRFDFDWRDDPRKNEEWYEKQKEKIGDPVIIAQELDRDFSGSVTRAVIPAAWIDAAVNAHVKLGVQIDGARRMALDVADEGKDVNATVGGQGILIDHCNFWSGKGSDIYATTEWSCTEADVYGARSITYDADGLGAGVRGDARVINGKRRANKQPEIKFLAFRGSGSVVNPKGEVFPKKPGEPSDSGDIVRRNEDYFENAKAQGWLVLRERFRKTYRAVVENQKVDFSEIISLCGNLPYLSKLKLELAQSTYSQNSSGKIIVDKTPDGTRSPNLADAVMIYFAPEQKRARGWYDLVKK